MRRLAFSFAITITVDIKDRQNMAAMKSEVVLD